MNERFISVFSVFHFCPTLSCAQMDWTCPEFKLNLEFLTVHFIFVSIFSAEGLKVVTTYLFCYMMIMEHGGL